MSALAHKHGVHVLVSHRYVEELLANQYVMYYIQDALMTVLLWRGHYTVRIGKHTFNLPLHSINAFIISVVLVEKPALFPSFFFASIAWLLLAVMGYRRNVPDPWQRCKTFRQFVEILCFGKSLVGPESIAPFENAEEAAKFEAWRQQRIIDAEEAAKKAYEEQQSAQEEEMAEMEGFGDEGTDIATKTGGGLTPSIDPFKPFLFPIQQYLGFAVGYFRVVKHVLIWEECYIAFWVSMGCFVLSLVCLFVPWFFLIRWTARIIAWTLFGPWMKLADIFYVSKIAPLTVEEQEAQKRRDKLARRLKLKEALKEARIKKENAVKLKDMKKVMFGKYITRVPVLKQDRHRDIPLPESMAVPYKPERQSLAKLAMKEAGYNRTRIPGQNLVGDMIPRVGSKK